MLELKLDDAELYDEVNNEFISIPGGTFQFEHSLKAIRKWEGEYKKSFLNAETFSREELLYYYNCMILDNHTSIIPEALITSEVESKLTKYIDETRTATDVKNKEAKGSNSKQSSIVTAEVIYGMMSLLNVPFEPCENWNINNLLMLIKVITIQQGGKTPMSRSDIYKENTELNKARRAELNSRG